MQTWDKLLIREHALVLHKSILQTISNFVLKYFPQMYVSHKHYIIAKREKKTGILSIYQCKGNELTYTRRSLFFSQHLITLNILAHILA